MSMRKRDWFDDLINPDSTTDVSRLVAEVLMVIVMSQALFLLVLVLSTR